MARAQSGHGFVLSRTAYASSVSVELLESERTEGAIGTEAAGGFFRFFWGGREADGNGITTTLPQTGQCDGLLSALAGTRTDSPQTRQAWMVTSPVAVSSVARFERAGGSSTAGRAAAVGTLRGIGSFAVTCSSTRSGNSHMTPHAEHWIFRRWYPAGGCTRLPHPGQIVDTLIRPSLR